MPRPRIKIDEAVMLQGWELEEGNEKYPSFLSSYDSFGLLARMGFRSRQAALAFALGNPAPRNVQEAGRYMKGL